MQPHDNDDSVEYTVGPPPPDMVRPLLIMHPGLPNGHLWVAADTLAALVTAGLLNVEDIEDDQMVGLKDIGPGSEKVRVDAHSLANIQNRTLRPSHDN